MSYIEGKDRNRYCISCLDDKISQDSIVRLIDAFVDSLDLTKLNFTKTDKDAQGRPSYRPNHLLKLYIWGYKNNIHSSRKLAESCITNIEVQWLMEELRPDFRTISDFRKDNVESIKKVFYEFNNKIFEVIELSYQSIDGTKVKANNSKDNNFTQNKLDDRIKWLKENINKYLMTMDKVDATESIDNFDFTKDELEVKIKEAQERLEKYEKYREYMQENNLTQMSLNDTDAKLMKTKNGFEVSYNVQTLVDSNTHIITDFNTTNKVTDYGLIESTTKKLKEERFNDKAMEIVADKGYNTKQDIIKCLENGIIPNVIDNNNKNKYDIEIDYEENECDKNSSNKEEIKKCLHKGIVPEIYKNIITDCKVITKTEKTYTDTESNIKFNNTEEIITKAKEGYFVRDVENNIVYCPNGETLRQSSITLKGNIKYRNKYICSKCPLKDKCLTKNEQWKDIEFNKDTIVKPAKWLNIKTTKTIKQIGHQKINKVKFTFLTDKNKMSKRFSISEHPFGTIKRTLNGYYFLLKSIKKVSCEFALLSLAYNIKRAINLLGYNNLMNIIKI